LIGFALQETGAWAMGLNRAPNPNSHCSYQINFIATWMIRPAAAEPIVP
jgi:hypothetical protein